MNTKFLNLFFFSPSICSFLEDNCFTTLCGFCHTAFLFLKLTGIALILSHGLFVFVSQAFARPFTLLRVSGAESLLVPCCELCRQPALTEISLWSKRAPPVSSWTVWLWLAVAVLQSRFCDSRLRKPEPKAVLLSAVLALPSLASGEHV